MRALLSLLALFLAAAPVSAQPVQLAVTPIVSMAAENNHVLKATPGRLYWIEATNHTSTAGFLQVLNQATVPSDGAVLPLLCVVLPANGSVTISFIDTPPAQFSTGITAVLSSATTCFQKTTGTITGFVQALLQ